MKRVPNITAVMNAVRETVSSSRMEKQAAALPEVAMSVEVSKDLCKLAAEIRNGNFVSVSYNDVMKFGSLIKEAATR